MQMMIFHVYFRFLYNLLFQREWCIPFLEKHFGDILDGFLADFFCLATITMVNRGLAQNVVIIAGTLASSRTIRSWRSLQYVNVFCFITTIDWVSCFRAGFFVSINHKICPVHCPKNYEVLKNYTYYKLRFNEFNCHVSPKYYESI